MKQTIEDVFRRQIEFQELCGLDIYSKSELELNILSETFLFKVIEEVIELRKTMPSGLNPSAKVQPIIDKQEMINELCDVSLFLINFMLTRNITISEVLDSIIEVQNNNFAIKKSKLLKEKQTEIEVIEKYGI